MIETLKDLPYRWGVMDCFQLAQLVRSRYGVPPMASFDWVYAKYTEHTFPDDGVLKLLMDYCDPCSNVNHLNLMAVRFGGLVNLATAVHDDEQWYCVYMGLQASRVIPLSRCDRWLDSVWSYRF